MKSPVVSSRILLVLLLVVGAKIALVAQAAEPLVLSRVEMAEAISRALPVYAQLQDAAGKEYALVLAPRALVEASGTPHRSLEIAARASDYVIALERRPGARADAARYAPVVYDDGRQIIARATLDQAQALAELGLDLRRLPDSPLLWQELPAISAAHLVTPDPVVAAMIAQVQESAVSTLDGDLSGEWPVTVGGAAYTIATRNTRSGTPIQKATQYVYEHMQASGLSVSYHDWSNSGVSNRNVIGELTGATRSDEIVVITAHLDDMPSSGPAPGADDNASGSAAVLTAAEILSQYRFERTLRFVLFTGEEQGLYGSDQYAAAVYAAGENIVAAYNMDMIGWDALDGPTLRLHTRTPGNPGYGGDLAIANLFADVVTAYGLSSSLTPIITADGIQASDHASFWHQGYAAILAIEDDYDDFNDYYHTPNDRLAALNLTYFANFVRASVGTAAHLAYAISGTPAATPTPGGDCCTAHLGSSCDGQTCAACVCDLDPSCCDTGWDIDCALAAANQCASSCGCATPTWTQTLTASPTRTATLTRRPTATPTPSSTRRPTSTPTRTPTVTNTRTPSSTRTATFTRRPSLTPTPTMTRRPTVTRTPTATRRPTWTPAANT